MIQGASFVRVLQTPYLTSLSWHTNLGHCLQWAWVSWSNHSRRVSKVWLGSAQLPNVQTEGLRSLKTCPLQDIALDNLMISWQYGHSNGWPSKASLGSKGTCGALFSPGYSDTAEEVSDYISLIVISLLFSMKVELVVWVFRVVAFLERPLLNSSIGFEPTLVSSSSTMTVGGSKFNGVSKLRTSLRWCISRYLNISRRLVFPFPSRWSKNELARRKVPSTCSVSHSSKCVKHQWSLIWELCREAQDCVEQWRACRDKKYLPLYRYIFAELQSNN